MYTLAGRTGSVPTAKQSRMGFYCLSNNATRVCYSTDGRISRVKFDLNIGNVGVIAPFAKLTDMFATFDEIFFLHRLESLFLTKQQNTVTKLKLRFLKFVLLIFTFLACANVEIFKLRIYLHTRDVGITRR